VSGDEAGDDGIPARRRARGCHQVGTDMLFEQIPVPLEFFGFRPRPDNLRAVAQIRY
jgi:hypothetical protein